MLTYTTLRNRAGKWTKDSSSSHLTDLDSELNSEHRWILSSKPWPFLEKSYTDTTVASQANYPKPGDADKINTITVKVGTTIYTPRQIHSRREWDRLNMVTVNSDIPQHWFVFANEVHLWPKPSGAGNTITMYYRKRIRDLSVADYTTGTITTAVNGDETIVGTGTSWTAGMADKWLRITHTNAANVGDGVWYEIDSITDGTNLELVAPYEGTAITAGTAAYTLADAPFLPEAFHELILYRPVAKYWYENEDADLARMYEGKFADNYGLLVQNYLGETDDVVLDDGGRDDLINPNLTVTL